MPDATPTKLSLTSLTAFGLAYMCPSLAMVIFGVISDRSGGIAPSAFCWPPEPCCCRP